MKLKLVYPQTIISLYKKYGNADYIGENMSQLEHALQTVNYLKDNYHGPLLQQAGLFHDIGHIMSLKFTYLDTLEVDGSNYGSVDHDIIGADYLRGLQVNENVCKIIENHVKAKRYIVSKDIKYFEKLSDASKITLNKQGGCMTTVEMINFERDPLFRYYLALRNADDCSKNHVIKNNKSIEDWVKYFDKFD